jgi:ubiquinone/menaquinone biosynthesis C-methylase UbiE
MPFGDIIARSRENVDLVTADEQEVTVDSKLKKLGLRIFGIPHTEMRNRARLIFRNAKINEGMKILDAGCGIGLYGMTFAIKNKVQVIGIDLSRDKIVNAKKIAANIGAKNIDFEIGDVTKLKFKDSSFDFILSSDVLEHVPDHEKAINEFARVLKKNGTLILTFPYDYEHSKKVMKKFGHVRPGYDEEIMMQLGKKHGLKIEKMTGYTYFFGRIGWLLNEKTFKIPALAALFFYPLYLLSYLDFMKIGQPNGLFVKLKKLNL